MTSPGRMRPASTTLAQMPPRFFRARVMPRSLRSWTCLHGGRERSNSRSTSPTRNLLRRRSNSLTPRVMMLRRCWPDLMARPWASISSRCSPSIRVTWQTAPYCVQQPVPSPEPAPPLAPPPEQGHLAAVPVLRPEPRTLAVAVALDAAPLQGLHFFHALHRRAALAGDENLLYPAAHALLRINRYVLGRQCKACRRLSRGLPLVLAEAISRAGWVNQGP